MEKMTDDVDDDDHGFCISILLYVKWMDDSIYNISAGGRIRKEASCNKAVYLKEKIMHYDGIQIIMIFHWENGKS